MKRFLLIIALVISVHFSFAQQANYADDIKALLTQLQTGRHARAILSIQIDAMKNMFPDLPQEFWDEFVTQTTDSELIALLVPVYQKYFDENDIKAMRAFYSSPTGQKTIELMPSVMRDAAEIGKSWGEAVGKRVYQKMIEKGYVKDGNAESN